MSLHALFFDATGTLIRPAFPVGGTYALFAGRHGMHVAEKDLMKAFRDAWKAAAQPIHPPDQPPADDDRGWWRLLVADVFARVLGTPLAESTLDCLFAELYAHYAKPEAWEVFVDVRPALEDLSRDHRLLVLSNFDRRLRSILEGHGLMRFFENVIISSEVGASKPHPRMFQAALAVAGCEPDRCLHIGDDARCDGEGAAAAGVHFFAVNRPETSLVALVEKVRSAAYSGLRRPGI
ncbi:MAG: HAD-IA family hydrolase [Prosthecobacter sp.]|jgi:putative hydrolase of the HAD superfamily|uniref:HAD-IA family hydrolase n=1 Tax=Prosthecobacter sp. TaxID=1965333 RepID=UPI001A0DF574|nr:HAD-IA family hydrolase [Prosthecobacter sp.]MBE2287896.1 HAD-IA family hydrolase [Prosthecobacter sp.]